MGWTSVGSQWITLYWVINSKLKPNPILKFKWIYQWTYRGQTVGDPEKILTPDLTPDLTPELTPSSEFQTHSNP
jgi:hypothetical protein